MMLSSVPANAAPIIGLEFILTAVAFTAAIVFPRCGWSWFTAVERAFGRLALRRRTAVLTVGISALLLRLAILPFCPVPLPFVPDDFSFLLAADTFAHGRLSNPTPAMWIHFESIHITMNPTYMSMYFPAHGLVMAASEVLLGHPWYGVLLVSALMCAAICWMLQAWMPASWALLGGVIAIVHLGLFSYWINTYHAAGSLGAFGGALILGALPRIMKVPRLRYTLAMAAGVVILGLCRPYECVLLCLPVGVMLGRWLMVGKNRPSRRRFIRLAAVPTLVVCAGAAWMGYYNYRAFGDATTLPYTVSREAYAMAPYYVWQKPRLVSTYRHKVMRDYYYAAEFESYNRLRSDPGTFLRTCFWKLVMEVLFFAGAALLPALVMVHRVILDRRFRFLLICVLVLIAGMSAEVFLLPHYLAPFTAAFYAIGLQGMRHLWLWNPGGRPVGRTLVRLSVTVCMLMAGARLYAGPLRLPLPEWPSTWDFDWYGPDHFGTERARVQTVLDRLPHEQLVIVRYSAKHNPFEEWVYNAADIDGSKVIWAREMNAMDDRELIHYYANRQVWLVEPDEFPARMTPYPMQRLLSADAH
jgi:hypothetical protein